MKNAIFITVLLFCFTFYAQHNYDNQNLIYSQNQVVTIGATTPSNLGGQPGLEIHATDPIIGLIGGINNNNKIFLSSNLTYGNGLVFSDNTHFSFFMENQGNLMRFQTNGDVSIGTINSATGYKLSIGGKIMTEGIRVQSLANWPDFVFNTSYSLTSLVDLEKYIKTNGHLPNIPTAEVVKKEGISLEEMSSKLLQKVEELTLYVIDINKENKKLKKEIALLKKNNNLK